MSDEAPSTREMEQIQKFRELLVGEDVKKNEVLVEQLKKSMDEQVRALDSKINAAQEKLQSDLKAFEAKIASQLEEVKGLATTVDKLKSNKVSRVQFGKAFKELGEKFLEVPGSK